jgi:hypothetical protein
MKMIMKRIRKKELSSQEQISNMYERYKKNLEIKTIMDFCFDLALFCF